MNENYGKVTIGATGDILLHKRVYNNAKTKDGGFDFTEMLSEVKPLFKKEHLIIANQESIIGGEELGLSCFPNFNSPIEIGYALKEMNVDIVNLANNHIMDQGEKGILTSINNWNKIGIPYVGAHKSISDQETLRIFNKNGVRVCFLSYTHSEGTRKRPKNKKYLVNLYKDVRDRWIRRIITRIRSQNLADVIVLSIHYNKEYQMLPTSYQLETAASLSDAGADIIIGNHPHVLQPPAFITNSKGLETFVAYSLGNFFTGQRGIYRQIGGYMTVDLELPKDGSKLIIQNPTIKLTYVDSTDKADCKLYLLEDIVKSKRVIRTGEGQFDSQMIYDRMIEHMTKYLPNLNIS